MSPFSIIVLVAVVLAIAAIAYLVYVFKNREQYTRERFAFAAMTAFLAFAGTVVTSIADKESPWTTIANLAREVLGLPIHRDEPRTADHALLVVVLGIVAFLVYSLYRRWPGAISEDEYHRQLDRKGPRLLRDGLDEVKRMTNRAHRTMHVPASATPMQFGPLDIPSDVLEWHLQAVDLVVLRNPQLRFDREQGYYVEHRGWIGEHAQTHQPVALMCVSRAPQEVEIEAFLRHAFELGKSSDPVAIVAVRNSNEMRQEIVAGVKVDILGEDALLDDLVDFSDYYEYLRRRVERDTLPDSDKTLAKVYAPSSCTLEGSSQVIPNIEDYLVEWSEEAGQRQLALLGEYGQGKSTTALMFAYHLVWSSGCNPARVPILIELRGRSPRNTSAAGLIAEWVYPFTRIYPKAVMKLIESGRAIVILEGFDEMALAGDAQARYAHFRVLWAFAFPRSKVLFTGRPNYFLDDRELKSALNIARSAAAGPYCESIRIEPFDVQQMASALREYPRTTRDRIIELAQANPKFREVASRGSLLYVIGELWDRPNGLGHTPGDINSAAVMGAFIRSNYERQSTKLIRMAERERKDLADFMVLNTPERVFFMRAVAYFMARAAMPNQIASQQLRRLVEKLAHVVPDSVSRQVAAASREDPTPLRERTKSMDHSMESIVTDVRTCGLLVPDPSKQDFLKFAHKSFMEYLVAEVETMAKFDLEERHIRLALDPVLAGESFLPRWNLLKLPEAMGFAAELLANFAANSMARGGFDTGRRFVKFGVQPLGCENVLRLVVLRREGGLLANFMNAAALGSIISPGALKAALTGRKLDPQIVLRGLVENGSRISPWVLYMASCTAAGVPICLGSSRYEVMLFAMAYLWLKENLPHLAPPVLPNTVLTSVD